MGGRRSGVGVGPLRPTVTVGKLFYWGTIYTPRRQAPAPRPSLGVMLSRQSVSFTAPPLPGWSFPQANSGRGRKFVGPWEKISAFYLILTLKWGGPFWHGLAVQSWKKNWQEANFLWEVNSRGENGATKQPAAAKKNIRCECLIQIIHGKHISPKAPGKKIAQDFAKVTHYLGHFPSEGSNTRCYLACEHWAIKSAINATIVNTYLKKKTHMLSKYATQLFLNTPWQKNTFKEGKKWTERTIRSRHC